MFLSVKYKPLELFVSLLSVISELRREVIDIKGVQSDLTSDNEIQVGDYYFLKNPVLVTHTDGVKFCRKAQMYMLVTRADFDLESVFTSFDATEAWVHIKKEPTDNTIVEVASSFAAIPQTSRGPIIIPKMWKLDELNFATVKIENTVATFGSHLPSELKTVICWKKSEFPMRKNDASFLQNFRDETIKILDETQKSIKSSQVLLDANSRLAPPPDMIEGSGGYDFEVDVQPGIEEDISTLRNGVKVFKALTQIGDRNDVDLIDSKIQGLLYLANVIRNKIIQPWINPNGLIPGDLLEKAIKPKSLNTQYLFDPAQTLVRVGQRTNSEKTIAGLLPSNSPADFYDLSMADISIMAVGVIVALSSGIMRTVAFFKDRRNARETTLSNIELQNRDRGPRPLRVNKLTYRIEEEDQIERRPLYTARSRSLPRNAAPIQWTIRQPPPVQPLYEAPLWRL